MRCTSCRFDYEAHDPKTGFGMTFDEGGRCEPCKKKGKQTEERIKVLRAKSAEQEGNDMSKKKAVKKVPAVKAKKPVKVATPKVAKPALAVVTEPKSHENGTTPVAGKRGAFGRHRDEVIAEVLKNGIAPKDSLAQVRSRLPEWKASDSCAMAYVYRVAKKANAPVEPAKEAVTA